MGKLLLVAVAASLLLTAMLQVPPLASAAGIPRLPPKLGGSFVSPAINQKLTRIYNYFKKHGPDVIDIGEKLLPSPPPPPPPSEGNDEERTTTDRAPAETAGLYLADLKVGTPEVQSISGVLDISTQLVWMQCDATCTACQPPSSSFLATKSETFKFLPCDDKTCQRLITQTCNDQSNNPNNPCGYLATYSSTMSTAGYLAWDTFTFGTTAVPNMLFGCSDSTTGDYSVASGVIGLGRGPLSLVSQLGLSNFSYFLAPDDGVSDSQVQLGDVAAPRTTMGRVVLSTPLRTSSMYTDLYYVGLTGIHVDDEELDDIPAGTFDLQNDGSGGVFLSTTIPVTYLLSDAYTAVRKAFANRISAPPLGTGSLDPLCYTAQSMAGVEVPSLKLVFEGSDAAMELRSDNYLFKFNDGERDLECLTVLPSKGASVLGSLLQTGTTVIYDLDAEQLTFVMTMDKEKEGSYSEAPPAASLAMMAVAVAVAGVLLS